MYLTEIETAIAHIIEDELTQMVDNILYKHAKNQINRGHNPFNCFEDSYIKNYMGMGRSFDSQLGNRLQNIAFRVVSLNKHKVVPNKVILNIVGKKLYMHCEADETMRQNIYIVKDFPIVSQAYCVEISQEQIDFYSSLHKIYKINNGVIDIPIDLIYFDKNKEPFYAFEIKAGGNLDTKNADANSNEVLRLEQIIKPIRDSKAFFATCYNNMGEDANPQGSIFGKLNDKQILIGKDFWDMILPTEISYDKFIEIYQYIFREIVEVDKKLQVNYE